MKNVRKFWRGVVIVILFLEGCSPKILNTPSIKQSTGLRETNSATQSLLSCATSNSSCLAFNKIPTNSATLTNFQTVNPTTSVVADTADPNANDLDSEYEKYQKGQITKGQMMQAIWAEDNNTPQNFYGKVIDQHGQPVVGANVKGNIELIQGFNGETYKIYKTQTDAEGLFQFTGLKGARLDADVEKNGYQMDYHAGLQEPIGPKTSPNDRAVFTMWKLKGPEPMTHAKAQTGICPNDQIMRLI